MYTHDTMGDGTQKGHTSARRWRRHPSRTGGSGALADTYGYDAFGAVRSRTGTSGQQFTYTGEQVDATGLQYLRARYCDASTASRRTTR